MTQFSDSQFLATDLTGLSLAQRLTAIGTGERQLYLPAPTESAGGSRLGSAGLSAALSSAFDLARDRLVVSARPWQVMRGLDGYDLRIDQRHPIQGPSWSERPFDAGEYREDLDSFCPLTNAMATALGAAQARECLGEDYWIIFVVDSRTELADITAEQVRAIGELRRFVIVWCDFTGWASGAPTAGLSQFLAAPKLELIGPIGAAESRKLSLALQAAKASDRPALVHLCLQTEASAPVLADVMTDGAAHEMGRLSEADPVGRRARDGATARAILDVARRDARTVIVDMSFGDILTRGTEQIAGRYYVGSPLLAIDLSWCAGLAIGGCRPIIALSESCIPELVVRGKPVFERSRVPLTLVVLADPSPGGTGAAAGGAATLGWLKHLAGVDVVAPADEHDLRAMLQSAVAGDRPVAIWAAAGLPAGATRAPSDLRQAEVRGSGADLALFAWGPAVGLARSAADALAREGIDAAVVNLRSLRPLDEATIVRAMRRSSAGLLLEAAAPQDHTFGPIVRLLAEQKIEKPFVLESSTAALDRNDLTALLARCRELLQDPATQTAYPASDSRKTGTDQSAPPAQSIQQAWLRHQGEAGKNEWRRIDARHFGAELETWIDQYARVGKRGLYLWKWCRYAVDLVALPCVDRRWHQHACDTKVLAGMVNVLVDDVADEQGNGELLGELLKIAAGSTPDLRGCSARDRAYGEFTCRVWEEIWRRAAKYPCFDVYQELLRYDLAQLFNTVRYSHLINQNPYLLNIAEHDVYSSQGMGLLGFAMIDLMCTPGFVVNELGLLREAMWHAQWMARIGNLISTWQREVNDRDYTSGVFARAVGRRDISVEQLLSHESAEIERVIGRGEHEAHFLQRWRYHRARLCGMRLESVDLSRVVRGLDRLLRTELASRGRK